jgi:hypothetical protein
LALGILSGGVRAHICGNGGLIICGSFTLNEGNGTCWAAWQAITHAITIVITQKARLAINNANGAFMTGCGTKRTTCAFFFVNLNHLSYRHSDFPHNLKL